MSPDNRFALVADPGLDQVFSYPFDSTKGTLGKDPSSRQGRPGSGPRHLVFSFDGKFLYVINELRSTVTTYAYDSAKWRVARNKHDFHSSDDFSGPARRRRSRYILPASFFTLRIAAETASPSFPSLPQTER